MRQPEPIGMHRRHCAWAMSMLGVLFWTLASFGASPTPVDVYLDMESGLADDLVTTDLLTAATHGSGGHWETRPDPMQSMRVSTNYETRIRGPVEAGGAVYWDTNSSRSFVISNWTTVEYAHYVFDERHSKVSLGIFVRLGDFDGPNATFYDLFALEAPGGEFLVLSFEDNVPSEFAWRVHTGAGTGEAIHVSPNKTYWVTALWDRANALATLEVYDPVTWQRFGTSTLWLEDDDVESFYFGRYDDHGKSLSTNLVWFDDLMLDLSGERFPLLPDYAGPTVTLSDLSPAGGVPGIPLVIEGANFDPVAANNIVRFGQAPAEVISASPTSLIVTVPSALSNGPVNVIVSANGRTSNPLLFTALVPQILVPDQPVDFGEVTIGLSATRTVAIANVGGAPLHVLDGGLSEPAYSWEAPFLPIPISAGETQSVTLRFSPLVSSLQESILSIASDDPWQASATVALTGRGVAPALAAQRLGTILHLRASTRPGELYQLESTTDLGSGRWTPVQDPVPGDGTIYDWVTSNLDAPGQRFYRLRVSPL